MGDNSRGRFEEATDRFFAEAEIAGFPTFLTPVDESSPLNSTPYLVRYDEFLARSADWPGRGHLARAMDKVRSRALDFEVAIDAILVGGSFTELARPDPGDIDCAMLYRRAEPEVSVKAADLDRLRRAARELRVDVRFIPLDGDPLILVKSLSYFTILFSKDKHARDKTDCRIIRALLLLDCRHHPA